MNVSGAMALRMLARGIRNQLRKKPLSVSFEITHACTANCWHCNWGGPIEETRLDAAAYARICRELEPVVAHVSGGEPLARGDVYEVVEAMARPGKLPWMVVVTNASQLTPERFFRLKRAGMHQLSVSLDFPDERHDEFRRIPGLFARMARVLPELAARGERDDVLLNVCITAWNATDLPDIVRLAGEWDVPVNFSVYTHLRIGDRRGLPVHGQGPPVREPGLAAHGQDPSGPTRKGNGATLEDVAVSLREVIRLRAAGYPVYTSAATLWKFYRFLGEGGIPGCEAGRRFLVINPDGRLTPCAMVMAYFDRQEDMLEGFTRANTCTQCYISTRANTEKTVREFLADNGWALRRMLLPWVA